MAKPNERAQIVNFWGKMKSPVWKYFGFYRNSDDEIDRSHAICKMCHQGIKYVGNTTNMMSHIARKHSELNHVYTSHTASKSHSHSQTAQPTHAHPDKVREENTIKAITQYIIDDLLPVHTAQSKGFRSLIHTYDPEFSAKHIEGDIETELRRRYHETKANVILGLTSADYVALSCEMWTSESRTCYVTLSVHFITPDFKLCRHVLRTEAVNERDRTENVIQLFQDTCSEWALQTSIFTSEETEPFSEAVGKLGWTSISCFGNSLRVAIEEAYVLDSVLNLVQRTEKLMTYFRKNPSALKNLFEKQKQLSLPCSDLTHQETYEMLDQIVQHHIAIYAVLMDAGIPKEDKDLLLSTRELADVEDVLSVLKPLKAAISMFSEQKSPSISLILPILHQLKDVHLGEKSGDSAIMRDIKCVIARHLGACYTDEKVRKTLMLASTIDPRFKSLQFTSEEERATAYRALKESIVEVAETYETIQVSMKTEGQLEIDESAPKRIKLEPDSDAGGPCNAQGSSGIAVLFGEMVAAGQESSNKDAGEIADSEIRRYLNEDDVALTECPMTWWSQHSINYPFLSQLVRKIVCAPPLIDLSMSNINNRHRIEAKFVDMILFLHSNT